MVENILVKFQERSPEKVASANYLHIRHIYLKSFIIVFAGLITLYFLYAQERRINLLLLIVVVLLLSRLSFNLFLIPYRQNSDWTEACKQDALKLAKRTKGEKLFLLTDTITSPNSYYLTRERNDILKFKTVPEEGPYFIVDDTLKYDNAFKTEFTMRSPFKYKTFYAGNFISVP